MKTCRGCGAVKPLEEFHKAASRRDGHESKCKVCVRARVTSYQAANPDRVKVQQAGKHARHRTRYLARQRKSHEENKPARLAAISQWQQENPDRVRGYRRVSEARRRTAVAQSDEQHTAADLRRILEAQRWKCAECGADLHQGYHADHIEPLARGGSNGAGNIQALCGGCNTSKNAKDPIEWAQANGRLL